MYFWRDLSSVPRATRRRAGPPQLWGPRRRPAYERAAQKL
jgi:hypothetical protein